MQRLIRTGAVVGALALCTPALGATVNISGSIDGSEPTWDNPDTGATTLTPYDTYAFSVTASGTYSFLSLYAGDPSVDANMDGFLSLYADPFNPASPGASIVFDDDYTAGDVAALSGIDGACVGQNCSGFEIALTAGTTYVLVQSTFTDVPTSFGQPTGPYDLTITGPGDIQIVPLPAAAWLLASGLLGLGALRRRG